jgi:GT2 family glycosyltransferase
MTRVPRLSAVIVSRNEGRELGRTVANFEDTLPPGADVVVVDDGSTDHSADFLARRRGRVRLKRTRGLGVARARNLGARLSHGDIIVFADAHIRLEAGWWRPLAEILEDPAAGGTSPAVNHIHPGRANGYGLRLKGPSLEAGWLTKPPEAPVAVPILPGCCLAMRRDVFENTGGWDEGMLQRGGVDNEGCIRLWLYGYYLVVAPEVTVRHLFRPQSPYPVGWPEYVHNRLRLALAHLNPSRLAKVVSALRSQPGFGDGLVLASQSDAGRRRIETAARRVRSDDWYFERFSMKW